jgi:tetratricopeptide (TPR) repeat protein
MSILIIATALAATTPPKPAPKAAKPQTEEARFKSCVERVDQDPAKAIVEADAWRIQSNGGLLARQCLGLAYAAQARWLPAMTAFEQAARLAERTRDGRAAMLWVQAGNAALAGQDAVKAQSAFDAALASGVLKGGEAGLVHLDRARALVAQRQPRKARADLDMAIKLVPQDPLAWLLSASLARRMNDLPRAQKDIEEAAKRAPDDAQVALEAGNIAAASGVPAAAKTAWEAAVKLAPNSPAGQSAAQALKQFAAK